MAEAGYQAVVAAPGFALGIQCSDDEVTAIDFIETRPEQAPSTPLAAEAARQLHAYLADPNFAFSLPLRPAGTAFQRRVWAQIAAIPNGQTHTYGRTGEKPQKCAACRRPGLRRQSLPGRRPLPSGRGYRRRAGRLRPRTRRLPARRQALVAET